MLNDHTLSRFKPLGRHLVRPMNDGYAFGAIAPTVEHLFGAEARTPLLPVDCFGGSYPKPKRIVTILVDAFGFEFWQRYGARSKIMSHILSQGIVTPISALFPSTTAASISTLNLGVPPSRHALYEWQVYIPAYGETIQSLAFATIGPNPVPLQMKGYDVGHMLMEHETVHTRLKARGVHSIQLAHADYAHSPYNSIIGVGAEVVPHKSLSEAIGHLRDRIAAPPTRNELIGFYWAGLDYTAHVHGPNSVEFERETLAFWQQMDAALHGVTTKDTLFIITADHGHVHVPAGDTIYLNHIAPELNEWLPTSPTGETIWPNGSPRDVFLHIVPERRADALPLLQNRLGDRATVMSIDSAIAEGLLGREPLHGELRRRLGDILVLPHPGHFVWWHVPGFMGNPLNGHHGGLSREEMTTLVAISDRL